MQKRKIKIHKTKGNTRTSINKDKKDLLFGLKQKEGHR